MNKFIWFRVRRMPSMFPGNYLCLCVCVWSELSTDSSNSLILGKSKQWEKSKLYKFIVSCIRWKILNFINNLYIRFHSIQTMSHWLYPLSSEINCFLSCLLHFKCINYYVLYLISGGGKLQVHEWHDDSLFMKPLMKYNTLWKHNGMHGS